MKSSAVKFLSSKLQSFKLVFSLACSQNYVNSWDSAYCEVLLCSSRHWQFLYRVVALNRFLKKAGMSKWRTQKPLFANFEIFSGKHLCWSLFFSYQKETPTHVLSCEYCKIFENIFFIDHLRWLLLKGSIMDSLLESFQIVESCISD